MNNYVFSIPSYVEIQGEQVLRFISVSPELATYELIGFEHYPVFIKDYRCFGIRAINTLLIDNRERDFAPKFNQPSLVILSRIDSGGMLIELKETNETNPQYMLWIAIGMTEIPPKYAYLIQEKVPFSPGKIALLSMYRRPHRLDTTTSSTISFSSLFGN